MLTQEAIFIATIKGTSLVIKTRPFPTISPKNKKQLFRNEQVYVLELVHKKEDRLCFEPAFVPLWICSVALPQTAAAAAAAETTGSVGSQHPAAREARVRVLCLPACGGRGSCWARRASGGRWWGVSSRVAPCCSIPPSHRR